MPMNPFRRSALATTLAGLTGLMTTLGSALPVHAGTVGESAPAFELKDTQGRTVRLADFKGRHVVLEWTNPGCPFVVKHYGAQNMQALQKEARAKNVVWLSISSTAPGHTDHLPPAALQDKLTKDWGAQPAAVLLDEAGNIGRAYGARTTPHMYVIDPAGKPVATPSAPAYGCSIKYAAG